MRRLLGLLVFALLMATPAFAQDVDFGAFSDAPPAMAAPPAAARGAAPARGAVPAPPPVDRLVRLRDVLLKAESPLTKEQETALNSLINAEIPVMRRAIQTHGQEMIAARQASAPPAGPAGAAAPVPAPGAAPATAAPPARGAAPTPAPGDAPNPAQAAALAQAQAAAAARGGAIPPGGVPNALLAAMAARGASASSRVPAEVLDALEVEMRQMNDALFLKIASAPALEPKQQAVLAKMSRDQIKARGGYEALRISMEDAKAPFTDEQTPKVQVVFEDQKKARAELARESQGTPDPAKLKQLERDTLTKVIGILTPAQRTALLAVLRASQ